MVRRILFVTNSLTGGGAERAMNLAANELFERKWPVAFTPINSSEPDFVELNCKVFPLNRQWRGGLLNTIRAFFRFHHVIYSWKPNVIVLTCALPELFGAFLFSQRNLVIVEEANIPWGTRVALGRIVRKILGLRGAIWVAASSHLTIWPNGRTPQAVLPNALAPFASPKELTNTSSDLHRLTYVGRLSAEKRPEWFIEICRRSDTPGKIMGDGLLKESLMELVSAKNLDIEFSGFVHDPWSQIQTGDLLIIPSTSEGDGLVVVEGLKANAPMLVADIAELRHFGLPEKHYCKDLSDFDARINEYRGNLASLIVPDEVKNIILAARSPKVVGDAWENFLNSIYQ